MAASIFGVISAGFLARIPEVGSTICPAVVLPKSIRNMHP